MIGYIDWLKFEHYLNNKLRLRGPISVAKVLMDIHSVLAHLGHDSSPLIILSHSHAFPVND